MFLNLGLYTHPVRPQDIARMPQMKTVYVEDKVQDYCQGANNKYNEIHRKETVLVGSQDRKKAEKYFAT